MLLIALFTALVRYDYGMKLFSRLCVWTLSFVMAFLLGTDAAWAQEANKTSIQGFIVTFSRFLQNILLPLLFSVAFLYFIFNTAKLFIIDGANEIDRDAAKRSALFGVAAFVFLILLWAIVGLFVSGLGLTRDESLCADYFAIFGGPCTEQAGDTFAGGGVGASTPGGGGAGSGSAGTGGTGGGTGGTGSGNTGGGTTGGTQPVESKMAELIFGTGKDAVGFERTLTNTDALNSSPVVAADATCVDGFNTLRLSSSAESNQAAYVYYQAQNGGWRWQNITFSHSSNYIGYDRDKLDTIMAAGHQKVYLVHTHPANRYKALGLSLRGQGPSTADFQALCTLNNARLTHLTVDAFGVWASRHQINVCPFAGTDTSLLSRIETYLVLATMPAASRATELEAFTESNLVPADQKSYFGALDAEELAAMSTDDLITASQGAQAAAGIVLTQYDSVNAFCSSL